MPGRPLVWTGTYREDAPVDGVAGAAVSGVAFEFATAVLAGIFSFCPTMILSVVKSLAERIALIRTPNSLAMLESVSPDLTV